MFGFGKDNKDKLKQNMDEIKSLINEGQSVEGSAETPGHSPGKPDFSQEGAGGQEQVSEQQQPQQSGSSGQEGDVENFGQEISRPPSSLGGDKSFDEEFGTGRQEPSDTSEEQLQPPQAGQQEKGQSQERNREGRPQQSIGQESRRQTASSSSRQHEESVRQEQESRQPGREPEHPADTPEGETGSPEKERKADGGSLEQEIPKPPETREINVPEIDKGPLFIRRQKFERASQMIQEMHYLSEEIEAVVNRIEEDVQADRDTERQVRELVHDFEDNRTEVETIISPGEE